MLPAEPLLPSLAAATGPRGNRGAREGKAGVRRLAQRMEAMFGGDAENYRVQIDRILHGSLTHLHFSSVDRLCLAVGRHPAEIWTSGSPKRRRRNGGRHGTTRQVR
jgi:hypothetical protein